MRSKAVYEVVRSFRPLLRADWTLALVLDPDSNLLRIHTNTQDRDETWIMEMRPQFSALTPLCDPTAPTLALTVIERDVATLTDRAMAAAKAVSLDSRERTALKVELDGARFNRFNHDLSRKALQAFVGDVEKLAREGKLARRDGEELIDRANLIMLKMK